MVDFRTLSATMGPLVARVSAAICDDRQVSFWSPWGVAHSGGAEGHWQSYHNAIVINTSNNCCTSAGGLRKRNTPGVKSRVAVEVGEVEARHRGNAGECDTGERVSVVERARIRIGSRIQGEKDEDRTGRGEGRADGGGRERERELFGVTKLPQPGGERPDGSGKNGVFLPGNIFGLSKPQLHLNL